MYLKYRGVTSNNFSESLESVEKFLVPENFIWKIVSYAEQIFVIALSQVLLTIYEQISPQQLLFNELSSQGRENTF